MLDYTFKLTPEQVTKVLAGNFFDSYPEFSEANILVTVYEDGSAEVDVQDDS